MTVDVPLPISRANAGIVMRPSASLASRTDAQLSRAVDASPAGFYRDAAARLRARAHDPSLNAPLVCLRTLRLERAVPTRGRPIMAQRPAVLLVRITIGQLLARRTAIHILDRQIAICPSTRLVLPVVGNLAIQQRQQRSDEPFLLLGRRATNWPTLACYAGPCRSWQRLGWTPAA